MCYNLSSHKRNQYNIAANESDLDPPLCAKFVPRISLHIWIKGGLGPTITSVLDRVWPPALCPCSLHSTPLFVSFQVSLAPQLCPLNCKNASTAVLPSVSGRIVYNLWSLCNLLDWQAIVSKCNDLMVSLKQPVIYDTYSAMPINWYSYRRWSLGVILYILPSGTPPFSEDRWLFVSFDSFAHQILSWPSVW